MKRTISLDRSCFAATILILASSLGTATARAETEDELAPKLFVDLASSTRIYPNADAALMGFAIGGVWRPTYEKCVHLTGEAFARFGRRDRTGGDLKMRTAGGALGALWGRGTPDRWFGGGAMFDLGWARVGSRDDFVMSGYLRGLLHWRLRKQAWFSLDARAGHVIVPVTVNGTGIKGPTVGLGLGVTWGERTAL